MSIICSLLVALSLAQASAAVQTGRISGRVTVAGTGAPIVGARVTIIPAAPGTRAPTTFTSTRLASLRCWNPTHRVRRASS
jgi:hypothetical protein